jgi:signal peptidase II
MRSGWTDPVSNKYLLFSGITGFVVALDQATKHWIVSNLRYRVDAIDVIDGFFQIVHVQNRGAAFGLGAGTDSAIWFFLAFTLVALGVIFSMLVQAPAGDRWIASALGLINGGAIGNAIDRADKQSVTDFLRFYTEHPSLKPWLIEHLGTAEYPSFNVADIAIVVGVIAFLAHQLFIGERASDP